MQAICGGFCGRDESGVSEKNAGRARSDERDFRECNEGKRRRRVEAATRRGTETLETKVFRNEVEGVTGYRDGEGHHELVQVKSSRRKCDAPGEEGEEVKSQKRKVILLESHGYVREAKYLNQEEAEEISFVPSAIGVPQKPCFFVTIDAVKRHSVSGSVLR